jgi:pilus assembly protein Flp/PilA
MVSAPTACVGGADVNHREHTSMLQLITRVITQVWTARTDDRGASMVEYGLLVVLIAVVAAVGAGLMGQDLSELFDGIDLDP